MTPNHGSVPPGSPGDTERTPICAAPFVTLEFDPYGDVLACCANTLRPLGNVRWSSLRDIWEGERARNLRAALVAGDLSLGCGICRHRLTVGHGDLARDYYDNFAWRGREPEWPAVLQFSLHNTCNLACVMCGADRSSRIRSRRSRLAPLPQAYGERFFDDLPEFLEHADRVDFSGGEPFLVAAHERVWDLMENLAVPPRCSVTTNGTVWNDRVERVLDRFLTDVSVSIDGITAETLSSIRVGADFDVLIGNIERFRQRCVERGTELTLGWSLTRLNWWELGRCLRWADDLGVRVKVLTVIEPEFGLQSVPTAELGMVVESLEHESSVIRSRLSLNGPIWDAEIARLTAELHRRRANTDPTTVGLPPSPATTAHAAARLIARTMPALTPEELTDATSAATADLRRWLGRPTPQSPDITIEVDNLGAVRSTGTTIDVDDRSTLPAVLERLASGEGGLLWVVDEFDEGDRVASTFWIGSEARDRVGVAVRAISLRHATGHRILLAMDRTLSTLDRRPVAVAVELGARRLAPTRSQIPDRARA